MTLEREGTTLVFRRVPARVCPLCGERYFDEAVTAELQDAVNEAHAAGIELEVREYVSSRGR